MSTHFGAKVHKHAPHLEAHKKVDTSLKNELFNFTVLNDPKKNK